MNRSAMVLMNAFVVLAVVVMMPRNAYAVPQRSARPDMAAGAQQVRPLAASITESVVLSALPTGDVEVERREIHAPMPIPTNLPVPAVFAQRKSDEPVSASFPMLPASTPALQENFLALDDDNTSIPPDAAGAVGPNHLVVALNTQIRVQNRAGGVLSTVGTRNFFGPVLNNQKIFDPRVVYDVRADRWIMCTVSNDEVDSSSQATAAALLLAVSKTGDPLGSWSLYRFTGDPTNQGWIDYPQLGFDDSKIVVSTNVYSISDDTFQRASVFVLSRATMSGNRIDVPSSGGTMMPTVSCDPGSSTFLIQRWNGNSSGLGWMRLYAVTLTDVTPVAYVQASQTWESTGAGSNDFAPQLGSSKLIDTGDDRALSAVLRNGAIWVAHTIFLPAGSPTRSSVQWWQVSQSGAVLQRGLIDDPSGATFYSYASIAVNARNDMLIGGSRFSAGTYASTFAAVRASGDPVNMISAPSTFKLGVAPYYKVSGTANRWGDYSTSVVDPKNDTDFWSIQEYAAGSLGGYDRWGTWWAHVSAPAQGTVTTCTADSMTACVLNGRFQVKVRYRGAFDNNAADTDALVKSVPGFGSASYETVFFYFNSPNNIELMVKMLDQGNANAAGQPTIAVLFGSATPLRLELTIADTKNGSVKRYTSAFATQAGGTDFTAFVK